jgi:hypothetical protein
VVQEPARTDRYLRLPDSEGLNVKLREGRIEIKRRVGEVRAVRFHERVTGVVEGWRKWRFELAEPGSSRVQAASPASSWISVHKERRIRTYHVEKDEDVTARSGPKPAATGCELELSRVRAAGQIWWTLAFEAFGDESALRENLLLVARYVVSTDEPPSLPVSNSRGYAAWLIRLTGPEASRRGRQ